MNQPERLVLRPLPLAPLNQPERLVLRPLALAPLLLGVACSSAGALAVGSPSPALPLPTSPASAASATTAASTASAATAAPTALAAAPPPPDLAWLSTRGAGPLCAAQAQGARRRLEAIGRVFGAAYFNQRFERREARNEAFFCREGASMAWSVSVAGLDDENAAPCSPEADEACAERAALATRAALRAVEAGREARTCWGARHPGPVPCDEAGSFQRAGELLHDNAHGVLPHAQLADVDADGRPEFVFLYRDASSHEDHSWYVALRAAGPGLPIEPHPAFLRPSVVGFVDVNGDGQRDLLTRAGLVHCPGPGPDGSEALPCHGGDAPLRCRLFAKGRFGPPQPCPSYPGAMPNEPDGGWAPPASGRCPSRLHDRPPPRRGRRRPGRPRGRRRRRLPTQARLATVMP